MTRCFKVAHYSVDSNVFLSLFATYPNTRRYILGEMTNNDTPLFVFKEEDDAKLYLLQEGMSFNALLMGESTLEPFPLKPIVRLLPNIVGLSPQFVQEFWEIKPKHQLFFRGRSLVQEVQDTFYGVYDFTPTDVLKISNSEKMRLIKKFLRDK